MFVSSYNTYVNVNGSQKIEKKDAVGKGENSFASKLSEKTTTFINLTTKLPINYISDYKVLNNQQKLNQQTKQTQEKTKFSKINANVNAKEAYSDNSKIFSFLIKPKLTINQTPKLDKKFPSDIQNLQEQNLRHTMVNTYIANDNYYKITA